MDLLTPLIEAYPRQALILGIAAFSVWLFFKAEVTRPVIAVVSSVTLFVLWTADDLNVAVSLAEHVTSVTFAPLEQAFEPPNEPMTQGGDHDPAP